MKIRCSSLDRVMACPASLYPAAGEVLIDHEAGDAARVGTAVHAIMADVVRNRWKTLPDVGRYCEAAGCPEKERDVRILGYGGMKFLKEYRAFLSESPLVECSLKGMTDDGNELVGHPDIVDFVEAGGEDIVYVIDWKTGAKDEDSRYRNQMLGYAALGLDLFADREPGRVIVILAWLRSMEATVSPFSVEEIRQLSDRIDWAVVHGAGSTYTPGDACRYCPRVASCPGRRALMLSAVEALTEGEAAKMIPWGGALVDADGFARSITQAKMLKALCEDHLRNCAIAMKTVGGDVELSNGWRVSLVQTAGRSKMHPEKVIPALRERFGAIPDDRLLQMVSLTKRSVEEYIVEQADAGEKTALRKAILEELEGSGAITRGRASEYVEVKCA